MTASHKKIYLKLVEKISSSNPFQGKRLRKFLNGVDEEFYYDANEKIELLLSSLDCEDPIAKVSEFFNKMSLDFLRAQIQFQRTQEYPINDQSLALKTVYSSEEVMTYYMYGLFASYFLWPNHYKIYKFFTETVQDLRQMSNHLEIAPGHGLFASVVKTVHPECKSVLVDVSETSLKITTQIIEKLGTKADTDFCHCDFFEFESEKKFDFIVMGEVLEHVNDPGSFLTRARGMLEDFGKLFITTCTDAPAIDHVYHFRSINEIRNLCDKSGLAIKDECVIPADFQSVREAERHRSTINYCALLGAK